MQAKEFGEFLRSIRNERGLTIRQIETYSGVSNSYLSQVENGKRSIPSPDILKKLAPALKVSYELLMEKAGYTKKGVREIDSLTLDDIPPEGLLYFRKLKNLPPETQKKFMKAFKTHLELIEQLEKDEEK